MTAALTIGIPTYQRRDTVLATVNRLLESDLPDSVEVLVIDDASTDGTYEALQALGSRPGLRVLRNQTNAKFVGNFVRLFEEARSDYLVVTSDEDEIAAEHLAGLVELCRSSRPSLVSPQAVIDGKMFRGRARQRPITPREWRASTNYISGTTYEVAASRPLLVPIAALAAGNGAAEVYPQVMLGADLLVRGTGMWYAKPLTVKREQKKSHITDSRHGTYWHLPARWSQYKEFESYLEHLVNTAENNSWRRRAEDMLEIHRSLLFGMVREAIKQERSDLAAVFDTGGRQFLRPRWRRDLVTLVRHPFRAASGARDRAAAHRWRP